MKKRPAIKPRKEPSQPRAIATVEAVMRATAHILATDGYDGLSTNRVAKKAGVSIGSLYQYFPSKESLVAALADRHRTEVLAMLAERFTSVGDKPLAEAARIVVRAIADSHGTDLALHRVLSEEVPRVGRVGDLVEAVEVHGAGMVRALLERRRDDLRVKNLALAAYVVSHAVEAIVHAAVLGGGAPAPVEEVLDEVVDLVTVYLTKPAKPARAR